MDNFLYIQVGKLFNIVQSIPESVEGDSVTVSIKRLSDGYTWNFSTLAFTSGDNSGSMTFDEEIEWLQSFTPLTADTYIVRAYNARLDQRYRQVLIAVGAVAQAGMTGTELTTLANLRAYLKKAAGDTKDDTLLEDIITRVSQEIEKRCGRTFTVTTHTEYFTGSGNNRAYLKHWPITSITSIHVDEDRQWGSDSQIDADDIAISGNSPGMVILNSGETFSKSSLDIENVRVIYSAGYSTIPADLEQKCIEISAARYLKSGGMINSLAKGAMNPEDVENEAWKHIEINYRPVSF
jgi:hypothetical protein